ncbi:U11/U12 small nuclear ribonucleoprotein [Nymphaea thermarum]|nr:U11/U12 small nuclear ribonucleoprotein [Nymphaea thermarum]
MHGMDQRLNIVDARLEVMMVEQQAMSALCVKAYDKALSNNPDSDQTQSEEHREQGWPGNGGAAWRPTKMDFQWFSRDDPVSWVFRTEYKKTRLGDLGERAHIALWVVGISRLQFEESDEPVEPDADPPLTIEPEAMENQTIPEISLHALAGDEVPHLMRLEGKLRGRPVSIDTSSTHNFICEKSALVLGCHMEVQPAFDVVVGDRSTLRCRVKCHMERLEIQGFHFSVQLYILAMAGADLVLGIWLRELGEVAHLWDEIRQAQERAVSVKKIRDELERSPLKSDSLNAAQQMQGKVLNGRTLTASIAVNNDRATEFIRRRVYKDKSQCYECGDVGHLSYECLKNQLGPR